MPKKFSVLLTAIFALTPTIADAAGIIKPTVCRIASVPRITANPSVSLVDGVIQGTVNASHTSGAILSYELVSNEFGLKARLGVLPSSPSENDPDSFTVLPYGTWIDGAAKGVQTFSIRVSESPNNNVCTELPDARPRVFPISIDVSSLAPGDTPVAFTYKVESFDGSRISTNFFPASGLAAGDTAPSVLLASDLGQRGFANPYRANGGLAYVPGPDALRSDGYNVLTWDHRGTFASGGRSQLGSTFHEGRDVSSITTWASAVLPVELNGPSDPQIGMVGAGFGGTIQLVAAGSDPRIDAIVPAGAWYSLDSALHPNNTFRKGVAKQLLSTLNLDQVRVNGILEESLAYAVLDERMSPATRALLSATGPGVTLQQLQTPTLLLQSSNDPRGSLDESVRIAATILSNPFGTPVKLRWFDSREDTSTTKVDQLLDDTGVWLETYVNGVGSAANLIPNMNWWDQNDDDGIASSLPFEVGFAHVAPLEATSAGGDLSFDQPENGSWAVSTLRVPVVVPIGEKIVGSPTVSFTYEGIGKSRAVYVRIVDGSNGKILGRMSTPVPVLTDGMEHTVAVNLHPIVFSASTLGNSQLVVQIRSAAPAFPRKTFGEISISNVLVSFPLFAT